MGVKKQQQVKTGDTVKIKNSSQKGTVVGQEGGFWVVKFANNTKSKYTSGQLTVC
jgi:hypothetical protein